MTRVMYYVLRSTERSSGIFLHIRIDGIACVAHAFEVRCRSRLLGINVPTAVDKYEGIWDARFRVNNLCPYVRASNHFGLEASKT